GPTFRGLHSLRLQNHEEVLAGIRAAGGEGASDYLLYPPALDSCFHSSFALRRSRDKRAVIIMSLRQLRIFQPLPNEFFAHLRLVQHWNSSHLGDVTLLDPAGQVLAQLNGLKLLAIDSAASQPGQRERKFYRFAWEPQPPPTQPAASNAEPVLIFADREGFAESLADSLRARGVSSTLVFRAADRNGDSLAVDLRQQDWAEKLLGTLAARGPLPARVLYLWNWDDDAADGCAAFLALVQARLHQPGSEQPARWLVATRRAQAVDEHEDLAPAPAAIWGFARSVQTEQPQWQLSLADCADASLGDALWQEFFATEIEPEVALRRAGRHVRRLRPLQLSQTDEAPPPPAYALQLEGSGRVDALQFRGQVRQPPGAGEVEIEVAAAGLNFRDLMKALGIYPLAEDEPVGLGDEFAGRVSRIGRGARRLRVGDRVMGFSPAGGAFSSHLVSAADAVWEIPASLSFVEGASIPVVFGTAYHALHTLARLRRGETILIHAAAGGVGLAALQLAQHIGATVFATAGSDEKRAFVRSLGVEHMLDSRTLDFADEILRLTEGRGVDVVLNSLAGAFQQKSLAVCAPHARFVEIGKRDLFENNALPLAAFQRSLAFFAFDLSTVLASPRADGRALRRFLENGFNDGKLKPIPCTTFPASDAVAAFRRMQAAQHVGKLVLEFDAAHAPEVPPEFWPDPDGTYLVTGGLSGFGLATAQWLAQRGARHLALLSRRGVASAEDVPAIEALRGAGVSVVTLAADVANAKSLAAALRRLQKTSPPLRGIFHSAMVLRDKFLADMTQEDLAAVLAPKMTGAWNLHLQTRDLPPLDCFVLFSSISSIIGPPGHANYAAANAFLDALAQHRRANGLHGLSVNWGQLDDVGVAAEKAEIKRYLEGIGVRAVPARDALAALARWIVAPAAQVGVMDVDWEKLARASAKFTGSPVFRELAQSSGSKADGVAGNWRETVRALPAEEQAAAVARLVIAQVAATLGMAPEAIDPNGPLTGMDSLMAVELKVRIEDHSGCALPIDALNADATAARLAERLLKQIATAAPETTIPAATPVVGVLAETAVPLLRTEATPLLELIRDGKLPPLVAGALMPWPITLFQQTGVVPAEFFARMHGSEPHVSLDLILETPLGPVGIFMLPLTTSQVIPGEASLLPLALEGIRHATTCGARCVALTGLIPSATNYGASVQAVCDTENLAPVTTGHATTVAAVLLNLIVLLQAAERELAEETVMFYGIGSIGLGALRLMLDVLPHPAGLRLCDPFRSAAFFTELETTLREEHGFRGEVQVISANTHLHDASVIIGATNVENVLEVARLAPGTLIVDDSSPHCLNGPAAFARFRENHDILFTEGGFVRGAGPIPRTVHVPPVLAPQMQAEIPQLFFSLLRSEDITGCILSALLSAFRPDLAPTIGLVAPAAARKHWHALAELGFTAAALNYEGTYLDANGIAAFRENTGAVVAIAP
ncbi:MAG: SDR family NAD(P)-dependent oxidoreductase, partial [Chthoniobacterales bacterium]